MKSILYISGTRADYGPARSLLKAIHAAEDLDLKILVTGMHLDPTHGETWQEIHNDGFEIIEKVHGRVAGDSLVAMSASVGLFMYGISQALDRIRPDIVMVLGDRGEMLAGAMAAAFQNILVVHLCGGSVSGSIDDSIRHAITKFAHVHCVAFEEHARRVIQMGEHPETVHVVGLPGGNLQEDVTYTKEEIYSKYDIQSGKPYLLVVQHSVTHSQEQAGKQIIETLEAVVPLDYTVLLANPNDDAGGREILQVMHQYAEKYSHIRILPPPRSRELFASIMAHAGAMIGNSSSGVAEAMSIPVPVINVGDRQHGREHHAYLLNVGYDRTQIKKAIDVALTDRSYRDKLLDFSSELINKSTSSLVVKLLNDIDTKIAKTHKTITG